MTKFIAVSVLAAVMSVAAIAEAAAWGRNVAFTGPRGGTANYGRSRSCANGTCSWGGSGTGVNGGNWNRGGSGTCAGGTCSYSGQGTGVRGNGYSYGGSVSR